MFVATFVGVLGRSWTPIDEKWGGAEGDTYRFYNEAGRVSNGWILGGKMIGPEKPIEQLGMAHGRSLPTWQPQKVRAWSVLPQPLILPPAAISLFFVSLLVPSCWR
jgi:hypothetical protein